MTIHPIHLKEHKQSIRRFLLHTSAGALSMAAMSAFGFALFPEHIIHWLEAYGGAAGAIVPYFEA